MSNGFYGSYRQFSKHMAYQGERIDVAQVLLRLELAASKAGFDGEELYEQHGMMVPVFYSDAPSSTAPRILIAAGIHGDEPAGPVAVLNLLEKNAFIRAYSWTLVPMLNPAGLNNNMRESPEGIDLNRDFKHPRSKEVEQYAAYLKQQKSWDLALLLHEDWEAEGFYLYRRKGEGSKRLAEQVIEAVSRKCPIDHQDKIDGHPAAEGIISPDFDPQIIEKRLKGTWPEALFLHFEGLAKTQFTLEAPSSQRLQVRIDALITAVETAIQQSFRTNR